MTNDDKPKINQWRGYSFIKRRQGNGILLEIWQDLGEEDNNKDKKSNTANQWKLVKSEWQEDKKDWNPPSDHYP